MGSDLPEKKTCKTKLRIVCLTHVYEGAHMCTCVIRFCFREKVYLCKLRPTMELCQFSRAAPLAGQQVLFVICKEPQPYQ
jgi:hypothetical protein